MRLVGDSLGHISNLCRRVLDHAAGKSSVRCDDKGARRARPDLGAKVVYPRRPRVYNRAYQGGQMNPRFRNEVSVVSLTGTALIIRSAREGL